MTLRTLAWLGQASVPRPPAPDPAPRSHGAPPAWPHRRSSCGGGRESREAPGRLDRVRKDDDLHAPEAGDYFLVQSWPITTSTSIGTRVRSVCPRLLHHRFQPGGSLLSLVLWRLQNNLVVHPADGPRVGPFTTAARQQGHRRPISRVANGTRAASACRITGVRAAAGPHHSRTASGVPAPRRGAWPGRPGGRRRHQTRAVGRPAPVPRYSQPWRGE
jgi:hypothetical protein